MGSDEQLLAVTFGYDALLRCPHCGHDDTFFIRHEDCVHADADEIHSDDPKFDRECPSCNNGFRCVPTLTLQLDYEEI